MRPRDSFLIYIRKEIGCLLLMNSGMQTVYCIYV